MFRECPFTSWSHLMLNASWESVQYVLNRLDEYETVFRCVFERRPDRVSGDAELYECGTVMSGRCGDRDTAGSRPRTAKSRY